MRCGRGVAPKPMRIQREGAQLQIRGTWSAGPGDNQARFLADLRARRDSAAIGYDELAARAHYPSDILKEAENGPYLPGLPILTAYVRACEGDVLEWEERWRHLNSEVVDDPDLPVRPAGASPAAVAGARAGVGVVPPDVYDPERIRAALRGGHTRSDHASRTTSDPGILAPAPAITSANGNHAARVRGDDPPDPAREGQAEEFSWLKKSKPASRSADSELAWPEQAGGLTSPERTDFWSTPIAPAPGDLQLPVAERPDSGARARAPPCRHRPPSGRDRCRRTRPAGRGRCRLRHRIRRCVGCR